MPKQAYSKRQGCSITESEEQEIVVRLEDDSGVELGKYMGRAINRAIEEGVVEPLRTET